MTDTLSPQIDGTEAETSLLAIIWPRLPRMVAMTTLVMFATFAGVQFLPQKFEAKLDLALPAGSAMDVEAGRLLTQEQLADIVSRLPADSIADLRQNGGGILDTTTLLRQRLMVTPGATGGSLQVAATAGTIARARAITAATKESYLALVKPAETMPDALEDTPKAAELVPAAVPMSPDSLQLLQQRLSLAWQDRVKLEGRADRIQALIDEGNLSMLALDAENMPGLGRRLDELATLEAEAKKQSVNLLPNHPTMRALQEEIDQLTAELSTEVQGLSDMVVADRDAARRLEDGLRDELLTATAEVKVDDTIMTGAILEDKEPVVTALPRPIRTDWSVGLAGTLAFLGQVGFFALTRPRKTASEKADEALDDMQMVEPAPLAPTPPSAPLSPPPSPAFSAETEHNWLETSPFSNSAHWLGATPNPTPAPAPTPPKAPPRPLATPRHGSHIEDLGDARIIAIHMPGGSQSRTRDLFSFYQAQGKRVVLVDIATRRRGRAPGISDLSMGKANFADVIHGSGLYEAALIPWGREAQFDPQSRSVHILIGALSDLYDVVVMMLDRDLPQANAPLLALAELVMDAEDLPRSMRAA